MPRLSRRKVLVGSAAVLTAAGGAGMLSLARPGGSIVPGTSRAAPVEGAAELPEKADVVIIGGGYVGSCAALFLAMRGLSVALCEKGVIAGEASGRSSGFISGTFQSPLKLELIAHSKALWHDMNALIGGETGYRERGVLTLFESTERMQRAQDWLAAVRSMPGTDKYRIVTAQEATLLTTSATKPLAGGLYLPNGAVAEPKLAAPAIAAAASRHGAVILQHCAARGIERSAGRVSAVITEHGSIRTDTVILAGGIWSPLLARSLGLELLQLQSYASVLSIAPVPGAPLVSGSGGGVSWRTEIDGGHTVTLINGAAPITPTTLRHLPAFFPAMRAFWDYVDPVFSASTFMREWNAATPRPMDQPSLFEEIRIFQPEIRTAMVDRTLATLKEVFPAFASARERERWAGALTTTPDNMPIISGVQAVPGLHLGTGLYYGLTMAPAAGHLLADLVTGSTPKVDPSVFRYSRFSDGTRLQFQD